AAMAAAVGALMAAQDQPVRLAGHSYGGNVALHAALLHVDKLRGLALFEPVFMRALALAGEDAALTSATQFFAAYTDRVQAGESDAVGSMVDYWFGPGAFPKLPQ